MSKSQSLTSVSIKDCTLRVPNKTTTLFLVWAIIKAIFTSGKTPKNWELKSTWIWGTSTLKQGYYITVSSNKSNHHSMFIEPRAKKIRKEASSRPEIHMRTLCFYYVASFPSSPLLIFQRYVLICFILTKEVEIGPVASSCLEPKPAHFTSQGSPVLLCFIKIVDVGDWAGFFAMIYWPEVEKDSRQSLLLPSPRRFESHAQDHGLVILCQTCQKLINWGM